MTARTQGDLPSYSPAAVPTCGCPDWIVEIQKIQGPLILAQLRYPPLTGTAAFQFVPFRFCPWCGNQLAHSAPHPGVAEAVELQRGATALFRGDNPEPQRIVDMARAVLRDWIGKRGHDRCWYYPEIFSALCAALDVANPDPHELPTRAEFEAGCRRYADEQFGATGNADAESPARQTRALREISWAATTLDELALASATKQVLFRLVNGYELDLDKPAR